jgi:hypothetical protein
VGYHRPSRLFSFSYGMTLYLAPYGWDHPGWVGGFYPDDLPPAWRLAYFFNEFDAVAVPAAVWDDAPDVAAWCEDSPPEARFFLELPAAEGARDKFLAAVERLGERVAGVLAPVDCAGDGEAWWGGRLAAPIAGSTRLGLGVWDGPAPDLRLLRTHITRHAANGPALLLFRGTPPDLAALRAARILCQLLGVCG